MLVRFAVVQMRIGFLCAALAVALVAVLYASPFRTTSSAPPDELLVLEDGRRLSYKTFGRKAKSVTVILHGDPGSRLLPIDDANSAAWLVAVDRPGFGLSSPLSNLSLYYRDLAALVKHLGAEDVTLVGHSAGTVYALEAAVHLAALVRHVVLLGPIVTPRNANGLDWAAGMRAPNVMLTRLFSDHPWLARVLFRAMAPMMTSAQAAADDIVHEEPQMARYAGSLLASTEEAGRQGFSALIDDLEYLNRRWTFDLSQIRTAVRILCGDKDVFTPLQHAKYLANVLPSASLEVLPGHGHFSLFYSWIANASAVL